MPLTSPCQSQMNTCQDTLDAINSRKKDFDAGKPFSVHKIASQDELVEILSTAQDAVDKEKKEFNEYKANARRAHGKVGFPAQ